MMKRISRCHLGTGKLSSRAVLSQAVASQAIDCRSKGDICSRKCTAIAPEQQCSLPARGGEEPGRDAEAACSWHTHQHHSVVWGYSGAAPSSNTSTSVAILFQGLQLMISLKACIKEDPTVSAETGSLNGSHQVLRLSSNQTDVDPVVVSHACMRTPRPPVSSLSCCPPPQSPVI
eukprot:1137999-Pelagomonas_calceolata.AAC.5